VLTNLNFLGTGQTWPPPSEQDRIDRYHGNKLLFENKQALVYEKQFKRIERVISNFQDIISYPVICNFQKLLTLKVADLLLGEEPIIKCGDPESPQQKSIDKIKENTDLWNTSFETAIDVSRYGDGLFYVYKNGNAGLIDVTQPPIWFPVVSPDNVKVILFHVLAWEYCTGEGDNEKHYLKVQIHDKGVYTEREYILGDRVGTKGRVIGNISKADTTISTGLTGFAIVQVPNVMTSDRITGMDDYDDVDSIMSELMVRIGQVSKILDKHSNPSVQGPSSALEKDPKTGEWILKMGSFFARDSKEDAETSYIVWDAQLDANFKMIERLINLLYTISEMGPALLGDPDKAGGALSGTALRFRMISPLAKVKRIAMRFRPALIEAIKLCSELGGEGVTNLRKESISITFQDGLPLDPKEDADIMATRTGQKQTLSVKSALKKFDGLSEKDAQEELDQIDAETAAATPFSPAPFSNDNIPPVDPNADPLKTGDPNANDKTKGKA
jgi:hypothetical protein